MLISLKVVTYFELLNYDRLQFQEILKLKNNCLRKNYFCILCPVVRLSVHQAQTCLQAFLMLSSSCFQDEDEMKFY
mgnify:CR=1 FL=1